MDKPKSNLDFRLMSLTYIFRDFFLPPMDILKEVDIEEGFHVLDYGCGPGSYILPAAKLVGSSGKIYALDIHPLAIKKVKRIAEKNNLKNVKTIHSDCETGLADKSTDVTLLYDTLHTLNDPNKILKELHRVLKQGGILSVSDPHMKEEELVEKVVDKGLFTLLKRDKRSYSFFKVG